MTLRAERAGLSRQEGGGCAPSAHWVMCRGNGEPWMMRMRAQHVLAGTRGAGRLQGTQWKWVAKKRGADAGGYAELGACMQRGLKKRNWRKGKGAGARSACGTDDGWQVVLGRHGFASGKQLHVLQADHNAIDAADHGHARHLRRKGRGQGRRARGRRRRRHRSHKPAAALLPGWAGTRHAGVGGEPTGLQGHKQASGRALTRSMMAAVPFMQRTVRAPGCFTLMYMRKGKPAVQGSDWGRADERAFQGRAVCTPWRPRRRPQPSPATATGRCRHRWPAQHSRALSTMHSLSRRGSPMVMGK